MQNNNLQDEAQHAQHAINDERRRVSTALQEAEDKHRSELASIQASKVTQRTRAANHHTWQLVPLTLTLTPRIKRWMSYEA